MKIIKYIFSTNISFFLFLRVKAIVRCILLLENKKVITKNVYYVVPYFYLFIYFERYGAIFFF